MSETDVMRDTTLRERRSQFPRPGGDRNTISEPGKARVQQKGTVRRRGSRVDSRCAFRSPVIYSISKLKVFRGAFVAESCSQEHYPKNLMRIIPTKGEKL